ncbi:cell division protein FtsQ/DivIB [Bifidobacterium felsineum]|uniref:cell division protein FtsQ/DivIB n=1 Tax=Bifidobacterium felsineum TaxID=2045440 RepID=UPI001BDDBDED|nr:FtsQ-type POTRA domain-containing protein [Bifidobacterium felsineum]MBT1164151.1 FtsQ-type POTRA domain-containing protein [Bifidobacterium felsineum]
MAGRTVSSSGSSGSSGGKRKARVVESHQADASGHPRKRRAVASKPESVYPLEQDVTVAKGKAGAFVDARALHSEDYVAETLRQTTSSLGVASRPKVVDFTARAKERRKASARVIAIRAAVAAIAVLLISALTWLLLFSSVFRLESKAISVSGANEWVSTATIRAIADKQSGKSLFLVSSSDVEQQLKSIPGVSEAKVSKHFPKSMSVVIRSQKPTAMLKSGDTLTAVDDQVRVLNSVKNADVDGIPVIEVKDVETSLKNRSIKGALTILGALPESMRKQITKVTVATQDSVTTTLNDGEHVVVWGDSSQLKLKMAEVDKILNDPNVIGNYKQVDVSAPSRPILK